MFNKVGTKEDLRMKSTNLVNATHSNKKYKFQMSFPRFLSQIIIGSIVPKPQKSLKGN